MIRLGVGIALSVAATLFFNWARAPMEATDLDSPKPVGEGVLADHSQFAFRASDGRIETLHDGKVIEEKDDPDYARLAVRVVQSKDGSGSLLDSSGAKVVALAKTAEAHTFRDEAPGGHVKELTIFKDWLREKGGFRARYVTEREIAGVGGKVVLRSRYAGFARPEK